MTDRQFATAGSPKDALLLQRAGAGEQAAFDDLVDRHSEPLARFAAELTDHAAEAHGVVALSFEALRERAATNSDSVGAIRPFLLASVAELLVGAEAPDPAEPSPPSFGGWDELDTAAQTALWHADVEQDPAHVVTCIVGDAIDSVHATAEKARLEVRGDFLESHLPTLPRAGCRENWFRLTDRPHDGLADASIKEHARDCEGCGPLLADARLTWTHFDEILTAQLLGSAAPAFRAARDAAPAVASSDPEPEPEPAGPIANPDGEPAGASEDRPPAVAARVTPAAMSKPAPAPASVMAASASVSELSRQRRGVPGVLAASGVAASVLLVVSAGALVDREGDDAVSVGGSGSTSSTTLADTVGIAPTPTLVTVGARSLTPSTDEKGRERQSADAADPETEAADPTTGSASNDLSPSPDEPESPESSPPPSDSSTPSPTDSGSESPSPSEPTESSSEPTETPTDSESPSEPTESPSESESPTESPSESDSATASPSGTSSATPSQ